MADYTGIASSIFSEPEYRDQRDLVVAFYLILNSDMVGVCPVNSATVAALCRTSKGKLFETIRYLEECGKLTKSDSTSGKFPTHCWWKSKLYHALFKGKYSKNQIAGAKNRIRKWGASGVFPYNWETAFLQLYENKYNIKIPYADEVGIPYADKTETETDIQTEKETEADEKTAANPDLEVRTQKIRELINHSEFQIAVGQKLPDPIGWVRRMVEYFREPNYPDDQIERGLEALFQRQREKGWRAWGKTNIREGIWKWIEGQVDNRKEYKDESSTVKYNRPTGEFD